jgi:hypothetical protein
MIVGGSDRLSRVTSRSTLCLTGFVLALCASCALARPVPVDSAQEIVLAVGGSRQIAGTEVTLTVRAVEDSRCPKGVTCVWAGDAAIELRVTGPRTASVSYTLHTNDESARRVEHDGLRIQLVSLTPEPAGDEKPRQEEYRVTLLVGAK